MLGLDAAMGLPIGAALLWLVWWARHNVRWYVERYRTYRMIRRRIATCRRPWMFGRWSSPLWRRPLIRAKPSTLTSAITTCGSAFLFLQPRQGIG